MKRDKPAASTCPSDKRGGDPAPGLPSLRSPAPPPSAPTILIPLATRRPQTFTRSRPPRSGSEPQLLSPQPNTPELCRTRGSDRDSTTILPRGVLSPSSVGKQLSSSGQRQFRRASPPGNDNLPESFSPLWKLKQWGIQERDQRPTQQRADATYSSQACWKECGPRRGVQRIL